MARRNALQQLLSDMASGAANGKIRIVGGTNMSHGERQIMIGKAAKPARAVSHLTSIRDGKMMKNHVPGVTDPNDPRVHVGRMDRGDADGIKNPVKPPEKPKGKKIST
jgi:hypothetical protein